MSTIKHRTAGIPIRSSNHDRENDQTKQKPVASEARKESSANYRNNVDQLNRLRERDIERALSSRLRG
jgi:hypothetical protein